MAKPTASDWDFALRKIRKEVKNAMDKRFLSPLDDGRRYAIRALDDVRDVAKRKAKERNE